MEWAPSWVRSLHGYFRATDTLSHGPSDDHLVPRHHARLCSRRPVGASYSGLLVGKYAAEHPGRVSGVVLADGAIDPSTWPAGAVEGRLRNMRERWPAHREEVLSRSLANASEPVRSAVSAMITPRETIIPTYAGIAGYDARGTLSRYPGPKLSIAAEALDEPKAVHHTLPMPIKVMKGVSHMVMMDRPEEFNGFLDAFLAGLR